MTDIELVACRCGREAEELLDGSLYGCFECFVSASSPARWNELVGEGQEDCSSDLTASDESRGVK